jgi:CheY-like chemotaxis protein
VTPVIVLSADATPAHMRRLLASGACAYLTKPLDLPRVLDTLDRVIGARQMMNLKSETEA